jgi:hypothetical protein
VSRAITKFPHGYGRKQNDLFAPGPNIRLNACVGWNGGPPDFSRYSAGYFLAGQRLVESVESDSMRCVDLLVYPIVMVYRHGVETALKYLRQRLPILFDDPTEFKLNHDIMVNWKAVRSYLSRLEGSAEPSELDQIEKTLKDLVEFDPNGMVFRYPEDKEGAMHLEDTNIINVRVFADGMKPLSDFLENCCGWVDYLIDEHQDYMQEMRHLGEP